MCYSPLRNLYHFTRRNTSTLLSFHNSNFQRYTFNERLPNILKALKLPNDKRERKLNAICNNLQNHQLSEEIFENSSFPPSQLHDNCRKYMELWQLFLQSQQKQNRIHMAEFSPSIISEMFFYHRIVDSTGFFCSELYNAVRFRIKFKITKKKP